VKGRRDCVHSNDQIMPVRALATLCITLKRAVWRARDVLVADGAERGEGGAARLRAQIMQANTENGHTQEDGPRDQLMQG
jgi:hypothetical protein